MVHSSCRVRQVLAMVAVVMMKMRSKLIHQPQEENQRPTWKRLGYFFFEIEQQYSLIRNRAITRRKFSVFKTVFTSTPDPQLEAQINARSGRNSLCNWSSRQTTAGDSIKLLGGSFTVKPDHFLNNRNKLLVWSPFLCPSYSLTIANGYFHYDRSFFTFCKRKKNTPLLSNSFSSSLISHNKSTKLLPTIYSSKAITATVTVTTKTTTKTTTTRQQQSLMQFSFRFILMQLLSLNLSLVRNHGEWDVKDELILFLDFSFSIKMDGKSGRIQLHWCKCQFI